MKLGACCTTSDWTLSPAELARNLEDHGFESYFTGDHTHIPVERADPFVDARTGKELTPLSARLYDPLVALAMAASVTSTIKLGTSICLINQRDPITTAKQAASLDHLSDGRLILGLGAGWNEQEMRNHGVDPSKRYSEMRERVESIKTIWTNEIAEYHGKFVNFGPLMLYPKPKQQPHIPIYLGGKYTNIPRVVEYADGWIPSTAALPAEAFLSRFEELQRRAEEAGRQPIPVTGVHVENVHRLHVGSELEFTDAMWDEWQAQGLERAVLILPADRDECRRMIDHYARFASRSSD